MRLSSHSIGMFLSSPPHEGTFDAALKPFNRNVSIQSPARGDIRQSAWCVTAISSFYPVPRTRGHGNCSTMFPPLLVSIQSPARGDIDSLLEMRCQTGFYPVPRTRGHGEVSYKVRDRSVSIQSPARGDIQLL